jgi:hypothetical protein
VTSRTLDIPRRGDVDYREPAMTGRLRFYDVPTAWGVVVGDDGHLYMMQGQPTSGVPVRVGERVRFEPVTGRGGPRATGVQRLDTLRGASAARTGAESR